MNRHIEDMNYYRDARTQGAHKPPVAYDEDGNEIALPTRMAVCPVCEGHGKHVNPSIDCGGLSGEDFDEDPDFRDDYLSGRYDVQCDRCGGANVVAELDEDRCQPDLLALYRRQQEDERAYYYERMSEIRRGA